MTCASFVCDCRDRRARLVPPDHFENGDRLRLALDDDVAERSQIVSACQLRARSVADDNPGAVLLVQRLEPRAEIHRVADDGVAHDRIRSDVAGDHRPGVDADADVELGKPSLRLPPLRSACPARRSCRAPPRTAWSA